MSSKGATRLGRESKEARRQWPWQRILQSVVTVAVLATIIWFWPLLMNWINRPIAHVEVHSTFDFLDQGEVEERLTPFLVNRFFHLDLAVMKDAVIQMAWVDEVSLRREWPDKLVINIKEQAPIARWSDTGLIGDDGKVFRPDAIEGFGQLPRLSGPEDRAHEVMQQYLAISQVLRPLGVSIRELALSATDSWWFKVDHVAVNIGRDRRMERIQRFIRLYYARLDNRWKDVARVDLRYLNGASVAWEKNRKGR